MSHELTASGKKHRFKDSQTNICFFIKKATLKHEEHQNRHEKHQNSMPNNQLT